MLAPIGSYKFPQRVVEGSELGRSKVMPQGSIVINSRMSASPPVKVSWSVPLRSISVDSPQGSIVINKDRQGRVRAAVFSGASSPAGGQAEAIRKPVGDTVMANGWVDKVGTVLGNGWVNRYPVLKSTLTSLLGAM